jgi:hypothetical protein
MGEYIRERDNVRTTMRLKDFSRGLGRKEGVVNLVSFIQAVKVRVRRFDSNRPRTFASKKIKQTSVVTTDIEDNLAAQSRTSFLARRNKSLHTIQDVGSETRAIVVGLREKVLFRHLEPLVRSRALRTVENVDGIFIANAPVTNRDQVIAEWVGTKIKHRT